VSEFPNAAASPATGPRDPDAVAAFVVPAAMTLPERIDLLRRRPDLFREDASLAARRVERWRSLLAADDASFRARLGQLGIDEPSLPRLLGAVADPGGVRPAWWAICQSVLRAPVTRDSEGLPTSSASTRADGASPPEEPLQFEHALVPWIEVALASLRRGMPAIDRILGGSVLRAEARGLLENLALLARPTLARRLLLEKSARYGPNDLVAGLLSADPPREAYRATVESMLAEGGAAWMREHPALARLLATRVLFWIRSLGEFAERLEADRPSLEATFSGGAPLGRLVGGGRGISDSHAGGRAVVVARFEHGATIVYKPRSMAIDAAWERIVESFNAMVPPDLALRAMRVLDRGTHGWMEFAARRPCRDAGELRDHYRRMGSLLAVIHALQGNDFHAENVVAAGPDPIAIDLETISVGELLRPVAEGDRDPATRIVRHSVVRPMLLPSVMDRGDRGGIVDVGALGGGLGRRTRTRLLHAATDFPRGEASSHPRGEAPSPAGSLEPRDQSWVALEDGREVDPKEHRAEVAEGYRVGYEAILRHRDAWRDPGGPLAAIAAGWGRILNRSTSIYARLLAETCTPEATTSGVERWLRLERLRVGIAAWQHAPPEVQRMLDAITTSEGEALLVGDVPVLVARGGAHQCAAPDPITAAPQPIPGGVLRCSAIEAVHERLLAMGPEDLARQLRILDSSYLAAATALGGRAHGGRRGAERPESSPEPDRPNRAVGDGEIDGWLLTQLERLRDEALTAEGATNWIDAVFDAPSGAVRPASLPFSIYSGRGGVVLLLERAYRWSGRRWMLDLAASSIEWIVRAILDEARLARHAFALQPTAGMGEREGLAAACWALGRHEGCGRHREVAMRLIDGITPRAIAQDRDLDVIAGSAGVMLLLAGIAREEPTCGRPELVVALGRHLADRLVDDDGPGWRSDRVVRALDGFGHGRAGIGLALLEAGVVHDHAALREAGLAGLRAEHEHFSDEGPGGWADLRGSKPGERRPPPSPMNAWCAGAEGIAISRAAALAYADEPFLRQDLDRAVALLLPTRPFPRRHLCCGAAGRAEALRLLGRMLDRRDLRAESDSILRTSLPPGGRGEPESGLSLFQGWVGQAWTHLAARLDEDRSVLRLEV